ncbi:MAG: tRNA (guanosine(46)-N7)-methyltransferase TrmB [Bacteroidales bacterium]|nr:tRNA (guanosine(46)-N7)-methyltransferase TrmB [Bacteroidales bacterium]
MAHHKLQRFAENLTFPNLFQVSFEMLQKEGFAWRGRWKDFFGNDNPIVLELGCGKGDYTIALARIHPDRNYIGVDIKGARLWRGAKTSVEEKMANVAFIRTRIELIEQFFATDEVSEIWITFPDPQPKKPLKRLTSPRFLQYYRSFLKHGGLVHLKTDSQELYEYTLHEVIESEKLPVYAATNNLYAVASDDEAQLTQTFYEKIWLGEGKKITYIRFSIN